MKGKRQIGILSILLTGAASAGLFPPPLASAQSGPGKGPGQAVACLLRPRAEVSGEIVRLSDIAQCKGGSEAMRRLILGTEVGRAPGPGRRLRLDPDWVLVKVRRRGVRLNQITWKAPRTVEITTAFQRVEGRAFEKAFRSYVRDRMPWSPEKVRVGNVRTQGDVNVRAGRVRLEVEPPKAARLLGRVTLGVRLFVDDRPVRWVWVTGDVRVRANVWVLDRPVRRGYLFTARDLRPMEMDLKSVPPGVIENAREVVGKRARRAIAGRAPIQRHWLERAPLVKRGDIVNLKAESESLLITAIGVVRSEAALGEMVHVVNLQSKKSVYGRVVDARTVQVLY